MDEADAVVVEVFMVYIGALEHRTSFLSADSSNFCILIKLHLISFHLQNNLPILIFFLVSMSSIAYCNRNTVSFFSFK